jgi:hypothetical protein
LGVERSGNQVEIFGFQGLAAPAFDLDEVEHFWAGLLKVW